MYTRGIYDDARQRQRNQATAIPTSARKHRVSALFATGSMAITSFFCFLLPAAMPLGGGPSSTKSNGSLAFGARAGVRASCKQRLSLAFVPEPGFRHGAGGAGGAQPAPGLKPACRRCAAPASERPPFSQAGQRHSIAPRGNQNRVVPRTSSQADRRAATGPVDRPAIDLAPCRSRPPGLRQSWRKLALR